MMKAQRNSLPRHTPRDVSPGAPDPGNRSAQAPARRGGPAPGAPRVEPFPDSVGSAARDRPSRPASPAASPTTPPPGPAGRPLDILTGRVNAPPRMPSWFPAQFDLDAAARGAREILLGQGQSPESMAPGATGRVVFSDADFTLLQTTTPVFLTHKTTGQRMVDGATGQPLALRESPGRYLHDLLAQAKARQPGLSWDDYTFDFTQMGCAEEILRQDVIGPALDVLKDSDQDPASRDFVVTARSAEAVPGALRQALRNHGADIDGVLTVNNADQVEKMGIPAEVPAEGKKALVMAALLKLHDPSLAVVRTVTFMDDTDTNLVAAMTTLPRLFPHIAFEFVDVVHVGRRNFEKRVVARSGQDGNLVDGQGRPMSAADVERYRSQDAPLEHSLR